VRAIGIDVGGTKIAAGVVDTGTGEVLRRERVETHPDRGGKAVLDDCAALAARLGAPALPVGIGVCEMVGPAGEVTSAETIDWRGLDVAVAGQGAPVTVESDVRAAALAEARFGAGAGVASFLYAIVGTGASVSLVLGGVPLVGARGNAIVLGSPPAELVASGLGLSRRAGGREAREVLADPACDELVAEAAQALGRALATLVNALDPDRLILGGSVATAERFFPRVVERVRAGVQYPDTRALPILPTALGADGGVVGAALRAVR
jgi:glucokinase